MPAATWETDWQALPLAWGGAVLRAGFKTFETDFVVDEELGFEPDGQGEHLLVAVEKQGIGTYEAQAALARHYRLHPNRVAFAGMKDKQGLARQWFSLHAPPGTEDRPPLHAAQLRVLRSVRNSRKLRRGSHRGNRFRIVLRAVEGDRSACTERLHLLEGQGVPNYFGLQRFGNNASNLSAVQAWFAGGATPSRQRRSLLLSAARSYLFNHYLAARVRDASWNGWIDGDLMALDGSGSVFASALASAEELRERLHSFDIHATGPLWGAGVPACTGSALARESAVAGEYPELAAGLVRHGLVQQRRPLRLPVRSLRAAFEGDDLVLEFSLPRGAYATSVLRELLPLEAP